VYLLNIRTGEKQVLKQDYDKLTQIVVALLMNKYESYEILDDGDFLDKCENLIKKYN
jgi:hypothetical protein